MSGVKRFFENVALIWFAYLLFFVCSLPIFTIGATFPALMYTLMQIDRGKLDGTVPENFFRSFKLNLKQGSLVYVIYLVVGTFLYLGLRLCIHNNFDGAYEFLGIFCGGIIIPYAISVSFLFGVEARFSNSIKATIVYSLVMPIKNLLKAIGLMVVTCAMIYLGIVLVNNGVYPVLAWMLVFLIMPVAFYIDAVVYNRVFAIYIPEAMRTERENEIVLHNKAYQETMRQIEARKKALAEEEAEKTGKSGADNADDSEADNTDDSLKTENAGADESMGDDEPDDADSTDGSDSSDDLPHQHREYQSGEVISRYPRGYAPARKHSISEILNMTANEADDDDDSDE